jgi:hypothetical protein
MQMCAYNKNTRCACSDLYLFLIHSSPHWVNNLFWRGRCKNNISDLITYLRFTLWQCIHMLMCPSRPMCFLWQWWTYRPIHDSKWNHILSIYNVWRISQSIVIINLFWGPYPASQKLGPISTSGFSLGEIICTCIWLPLSRNNQNQIQDLKNI